MLWTEDSAGTNAIGTALEIDHAVQVFSAEHFLAEQHGWWCSAAPIHDPVTGVLLGVVDISGPLRTAHPHSLGLVSAAAGMAEDSLRFRRAADEDRLRAAYLERTATLGRHRSAMVDRDGRVLIAQPAGWVGGAIDVARRRRDGDAPRRARGARRAARGRRARCCGARPGALVRSGRRCGSTCSAARGCSARIGTRPRADAWASARPRSSRCSPCTRTG